LESARSLTKTVVRQIAFGGEQVERVADAVRDARDLSPGTERDDRGIVLRSDAVRSRAVVQRKRHGADTGARRDNALCLVNQRRAVGEVRRLVRESAQCLFVLMTFAEQHAIDDAFDHRAQPSAERPFDETKCGKDEERNAGDDRRAIEYEAKIEKAAYEQRIC